jgi:arsenite methyltransferase
MPRSIPDIVGAKYREAAERIASNSEPTGCCGPSADGDGGGSCCDPVTSNLYNAAETLGLPERAVRGSLGCGNPTALAELHPGEIVLDLGSGGGLDVLLSARRVAPGGKAYGLDMTEEMLALARDHQAKAGIANAEFLKGHLEAIPLPPESVDVIISNCVINLSGDKGRVIREAFRVLKPGGRFAVSDIVVRGDVPAAVRQSMELWVGCIAGALGEGEFRDLLVETGFSNVSIEPTRIYDFDDARAILAEAGLDADTVAREVDGRILSAFVRARKPQDAGARREPA